MLEDRFVNLNPFIQQMFLKLHDIEDSEKRDFILETLRKEFRDVVIEARKKISILICLLTCRCCKFPLSAPSSKALKKSTLGR
jgi:hypothetical protein